MTDATPTLKHGDSYLVIYRGGPNDARTDTRIATEAGWDQEIIVNGLENSFAAEFSYRFVSASQVGEQVQVIYEWNPDGADELIDNEERYDS